MLLILLLLIFLKSEVTVLNHPISPCLSHDFLLWSRVEHVAKAFSSKRNGDRNVWREYLPHASKPMTADQKRLCRGEKQIILIVFLILLAIKYLSIIKV